MRSTVPGRSALTVTPCTAAIVPIALNVAGHSSCCATTVVTASGGGWKAAPCAIAVWICWNLTTPSPATITSVAVSITIIRFNIFPSLLGSTVPRFHRSKALTLERWNSGTLERQKSLTDVQQHARVNAMPVPLLLAEERRRVVLRLHRDEAVITTQSPTARVPCDTAADIAGQKCFGVVYRQHTPLEQRQAADTTGEVRHDGRSIRRGDGQV